MRYVPAIALGLAVLALVALVIPLVLTQKHLTEAQTELARTNEQLVQNRNASDQLEQTISNLKTELDAGNDLKEQLATASDQLRQSKSDGDSAQSKLGEEEIAT